MVNHPRWRAGLLFPEPKRGSRPSDEDEFLSWSEPSFLEASIGNLRARKGSRTIPALSQACQQSLLARYTRTSEQRTHCNPRCVRRGCCGRLRQDCARKVADSAVPIDAALLRMYSSCSVTLPFRVLAARRCAFAGLNKSQ